MLEASARQEYDEAAALVSSELQKAKKVFLINHFLFKFLNTPITNVEVFPVDSKS